MCVTFVVSRDSVDECKVFIAWVIEMQPALVNSELHIWFAPCFSVDYEHPVLIIIGDPILLYDIDQINNVGDGPLSEANIFVIARHICLVVHYHGTNVALESHTSSGIGRICDQCWVAK